MEDNEGQRSLLASDWNEAALPSPGFAILMAIQPLSSGVREVRPHIRPNLAPW
jgi:hypothetical protein